MRSYRALQKLLCIHIHNYFSILTGKAFSSVQFNSVQSLSHVRLFVTPWTAARQASLSITNSRSSPKLRSIESVMPSNHLILCHPLLLLPSIFPRIRVFSNESTLHIRWPKYWRSASTWVLSMYTQDWSPLWWTGWISLQSRDSQESSPTPQFKSINSSALSKAFIFSFYRKGDWVSVRITELTKATHLESAGARICASWVWCQSAQNTIPLHGYQVGPSNFTMPSETKCAMADLGQVHRTGLMSLRGPSRPNAWLWAYGPHAPGNGASLQAGVLPGTLGEEIKTWLVTSSHRLTERWWSFIKVEF